MSNQDAIILKAIEDNTQVAFECGYSHAIEQLVSEAAALSRSTTDVATLTALASIAKRAGEMMKDIPKFRRAVEITKLKHAALRASQEG